MDASVGSNFNCTCGCYGPKQHGPPSPLTVACHHGHTPIVARLLLAGAAVQNRPNALRALGLALEDNEEEDVLLRRQRQECAWLLKGELFKCAVCGEPAAHKFRCGTCKMAYYCSQEHKAEHHTAVACSRLRAAAAVEDAATRAFTARGAHAAADDAPLCEPCEESPRETGDDAARPRTFGECSICFEDLPLDDSDPESRREATPCAHLFHSVCLRQWLKNKKECPKCKYDLSSEV